MHAVRKGNLDVIRFLSQYGAEINVVDKNAWTSLMYAAQSGYMDVGQFLLDVKADVSIENSDNRTAIFIATTNGYTNIQRLLVQHMPHVHQTTGKAPTQLPDHCFIFPFEVKLHQFIGSENVGGNYRALWLDAEVVVKLFVPEASATTFAHEVAVWHQLRHPNVIKLYGACDIGHRFFVCEWASNGSLIEHLTACEKRGERRTPWKYLYEAALGLAYLHERKIVHGNLCSNSILVGSDGVVKLADFQVSGLTTVLSSGGRPNVSYGSFCWQAPERLQGEAASHTSDIYSFCLCVVAAVTGRTPLEGRLDDHSKLLKEQWDAMADLGAYFAPVQYGMTVDLKWLASKMCGKDPRSRVSASTVVRMLEGLATRESKNQQQLKVTPELIVHISEYHDGDLLRRWRKLQDVATNISVDQPQLAVFRDLQTLYKCLSTENRPVVLLEQFYNVITDCIGAIDVDSHQYRILRLSSTKAQGHSMTAIYRRIDAIWAAIDDTHATEECKLRREEQRLKQQEAFVSEVSQTLVVLDKLGTDEDREAFVAFLKKEIDSHGSLYSAAHLTVLQKAYIDLNTYLKSDAVATMPERFLAWYELEIDGANYLAEGAYGKVYRVKWLESEVIVK